MTFGVSGLCTYGGSRVRISEAQFATLTCKVICLSFVTCCLINLYGLKVFGVCYLISPYRFKVLVLRPLLSYKGS